MNKVIEETGITRKERREIHIVEETTTNAIQGTEQLTSGTQISTAEQHIPSKSIVLFCHPRNSKNLEEAFAKEIEDAPQELPMHICWSGTSGLLHMGVVVLEWYGTITKEFLYNLSIDHEIFDYVIYDQPCSQQHLYGLLPAAEKEHQAS